MIEIRKYLERDYESVASICQETAKKGYQNQVSCWMFLDYYLESEPEHAFVAVEDGKVIGYGVCSINPKLYQKMMIEKWIPRISNYRRYLGIFSRLALRFHLKQAQIYDSSFHMNIAPSHQKRGIGRKLLDQMVLHLRQYRKNNLYCITENKKTMGYGFYRHYGFTLVCSFFGTKVLMYTLTYKGKEQYYV